MPSVIGADREQDGGFTHVDGDHTHPQPTPIFDPSLYNPVPPKPSPDGLNYVNLDTRRRGSQMQGRALEILGHAVEYIVDSRMFMIDQPSTRADAEAVQLLMLLSRQVFAECAEVTPPARRLRHWISQRLNPAANC
jgi:hypothetical protein